MLHRVSRLRLFTGAANFGRLHENTCIGAFQTQLDRRSKAQHLLTCQALGPLPSHIISIWQSNFAMQCWQQLLVKRAASVSLKQAADESNIEVEPQTRVVLWIPARQPYSALMPCSRRLASFYQSCKLLQRLKTLHCYCKH